ncbi:hypothetical protein CLU79DRAFT_836315 [Phycomyces nitens]|nr:hypothetical protein CLU79DRAFT_836315 [Phycomyces nitens]
MAKTTSIVVGLAAAAAVTYKFKDDLIHNTSDIHTRLNKVNQNLQVNPQESTQSFTKRPSMIESVPVLADSQRYVSEKFVPSVKHGWNEKVRDAAHTIVHTDYIGCAQKIWEDKVMSQLKK